MSGLKSRRRGARGEYACRDYLRARGWTANRVPLSGASEAMKGDVIAEKDGVKLTFEVKNHSNTFDKIYELYFEHIKTQQDDVLAYVAAGEPGHCITISTSLEAVMEGPMYYPLPRAIPLFAKYLRTFNKITRMQDLVKGADYLVLLDNRKPLLFIRYK